MSDLEEDILRSLRRITRSIDLHSRKLANTFGLTGPQLVCLRALREVESATAKGIADEMSLSQATVTGIIDRLVSRQLVERKRNPTDRRQVTLTITDAGRAMIEQAPSPLQETFVSRLSKVSETHQENIRATLEEIVRMMDGEDLEAAPVLSTSSTAQSPEEAEAVLSQAETDVAPGAEVSPAIDALPLPGEDP